MALLKTWFRLARLYLEDLHFVLHLGPHFIQDLSHHFAGSAPPACLATSHTCRIGDDHDHKQRQRHRFNLYFVLGKRYTPPQQAVNTRRQGGCMPRRHGSIGNTNPKKVHVPADQTQTTPTTRKHVTQY